MRSMITLVCTLDRFVVFMREIVFSQRLTRFRRNLTSSWWDFATKRLTLTSPWWRQTSSTSLYLRRWLYSKSLRRERQLLPLATRQRRKRKKLWQRRWGLYPNVGETVGNHDSPFVIPRDLICWQMCIWHRRDIWWGFITQIEEFQYDISEKEKQLARVQEQEKVLIQSFAESIGDNNKFKDFLLKVGFT